MIEIARLDKSEFPVLKTIGEGFLPDPKISIALIAKDGNDIIGRIFLLAPTHIEGIWIKSGHRNRFLGKRLMDAAQSEAKRCGLTRLFAYGAYPETEEYLSRLGFKKEPLTVWAKDI